MRRDEPADHVFFAFEPPALRHLIEPRRFIGDRAAPQLHAATSQIVYATLDAISESGALQPWSVVWHIGEAERGAVR